MKHRQDIQALHTLILQKMLHQTLKGAKKTKWRSIRECQPNNKLDYQKKIKDKRRKEAHLCKFLSNKLGKQAKVITEFTLGLDNCVCRSLKDLLPLIDCLGRESKAEEPFETDEDASLSFPIWLLFTKLAWTPLELGAFAFLFLTRPFGALDCFVWSDIFTSSS